jgi:peptide/nickel transport system substrate-binding protein
MEGNVNELVYQPIKQDGTRLAALLSGEVDFVLDPPPQDVPRLKRDPKIKVVEGNENRTIFFGFDQSRAGTRSRTSACARPSSSPST